jgi:hypothetical protein
MRSSAVLGTSASRFGGTRPTRIDQPLLAEDRSGKRHAIQPGLITVDGRGPAACSSMVTVKIVMSVITDQPLRATARKEPGTVQPACTRCRKYI